jgi:hypothetical protein
MGIVVFLVLTLLSLGGYHCFGAVISLHLQVEAEECFYPEFGGDIFL